jgi:hypothetical protein
LYRTANASFGAVYTLNQIFSRPTLVLGLGWRSGLGTELLVRSPDQSPVVSLGIISEASDEFMCLGSNQSLRNEYQDIPGCVGA